MMKRLLPLFMAVGLLGRTASADIWDDLASYEMGQPGDPPVPEKVQALITQTPPAQRGPIESALIKIIESDAATQHAKWFSCRMLQRVGTDQCVPTLAPLLNDPRLSHFARLALERMIESESAGAALRAALETVPDALKAGILGSLAERHDTQAISQITALASNPEPLLRTAALQSLGKIGGPNAKKALLQVKGPGQPESAWVDAALSYAEQALDAEMFQTLYNQSKEECHRAAALVGLLATDEQRGAAIAVDLLQGDDSYLRRTALRCVAAQPSAALTQAVSDMLGALTFSQRTELVLLLGERGDPAALRAVSQYLDSGDRKLRSAAITAVGQLGNARSLLQLLLQANDPDYRQLALESIASMSNPGVNDTLIAALQVPRTQESAIQALARRNVTQAAPALVRLTAHERPEIRGVAWKGLGAIAAPADLEQLMTLMLAVPNDTEKQEAQKAIQEVCSRASDKNACLNAVASHYDTSDESVKLFILDIAGAAGGPKALAITRTALRSGNKNLHDKAVRRLAAWPSDAAAPDLLDLAQNAPDNVTRLVSLQGFIKMTDKTGKAGDKLARLQSCLDLVERVEEKRLFIGALKNIRHPEALAMIVACLQDPQVAPEAQVAAVDLARHLAKPNPAEVAAAMEKVLQSSDLNADLRKKARDLLQQTSSPRAGLRRGVGEQTKL